MPTIDVECPECATTLSIEEDQLGTDLKCPKCKFVFLAEKPDGAYGFADPAPRPRPTKPTRQPSTPTSKPKSETETETETERQLRERMEKWADDLE